ncbi:uncharacterized GPI-anchored protein At4g28100-like [Olea europaea var. sylvestris]|uniref:uncharacterized GPI-anchored protein At4g28100-like n=1 Tax=Olea europaea var. sylvestris TaxID=158386 RepID=UPI000C1D64FA|nr:uncharacterized GPI-anchored protein At4g28100-like [Olea europaea var. sylvestris]
MSFFTSFFFFTFHISALFASPNPDPVTIPTQTVLPVPSPPVTIPAFPEQSDIAACPLDLPDQLFYGIKSACGSKTHNQNQLHRTRCCPVLAAWLYSAYSSTALQAYLTKSPPQIASYDMPVLPDDSETCVDTLEKALGSRGIELKKPNETCDVVYCYCGIRLHPFTCPEAFYVNSRGKLVGSENVKRLEKDCLSNSVNGYAGLGGCSKCLKSLHSLKDDRAGRTNISDERASKMHNRDCELMGLTWLLNKNRTVYIHTVSAVLRTLMMSTGDVDPQFCSLNSDGMPLAVDSTEVDDQNSSSILTIRLYHYLLLLSLLYLSILVSFSRY